MEVFLVIALIIAGVYILILRSDREDYKNQAGNEKKRVDGVCEQEKQKYARLCAEEKKKYETLCAEVAKKYEQLCIDEKKKYEALCTEVSKQKGIYERLIREFDIYIRKKCETYPQLAAIQADLLTLHYESSAQYLESKKRPAYTEAFRIRELRNETKSILAQKKLLEYQLSYIQLLFPNIMDIFDTGFNADQEFDLETEETTDRVRMFLSPEEFSRLTTTQRNQLALDRYVANRKSKWQIGRDFEMYIGYQYESQGYQVQYTGIIKNLEDMGRDLIAIKGHKTYIIQCKNWAKSKTIHEKHIFQLFGTVILYNIEHPLTPAVGVFVATTQLSPTALKVAQALNIQVVCKEQGEFPRVKCNINHTTGEKIYHLPFDQQYDHVVIDGSCGECYAFTVQEAESKGFRRAFRHFAT